MIIKILSHPNFVTLFPLTTPIEVPLKLSFVVKTIEIILKFQYFWEDAVYGEIESCREEVILQNIILLYNMMI